MLVAKVHLDKGCNVPSHHHESEQMAIVLSGRVQWTLGHEARVIESTAGDIVHLPSNEPHSVLALEDTDILDVLSPVGPMGVDAHTADA